MNNSRKALQRFNRLAAALLVAGGVLGLAVFFIGSVLGVSLLVTGISAGTGWTSAAGWTVLVLAAAALVALREMLPRAVEKFSSPLIAH